MFKSLIIATLLLSSVPVFSQEVTDPALFIASVEVQQVANPEDKLIVELPKVPKNPIDEIAMYVDGLIALGKKIWPIIEAGRPVINTSGIAPSNSIIPHIEGSTPRVEFSQMANWSAPRVVSYRVSYKNLYGMEVVGFTYTVFFQFNGSLKGNGKYITSLKVQASEISTAWGFNFDAASELVNVANVGTDEDPVASGIIQISYKAKGFLNEMRDTQSFYVDGAGAMKLLGK